MQVKLKETVSINDKRTEERNKRKIKQSLEAQYYNLIFYSSYRAFLFYNGVFLGSIKFSTHPGGSHLGV